MESFVISNFKYGLDTRRSELTSQPGTLMTLENGHVNSGGEIEKRKAFVDMGMQQQTGEDVPTFGLEATKDGLVVFCGKQPTTLPVGTIAQVLAHPPIEGVTLDLIAVIASCNFNGKAFAIAQFNYGRRVLFYDGVAIAQSLDGLVYTQFTTNPALGSNLAAAINAIEGWIATDNLDGTVTVKSPPGVYYTPLPEKSTESGLLGYQLVDKDFAGATGTPAFASFAIATNGTPGVTSYEVTAPANADGTGTASLCTVLAAASDVATAIAISNAINSHTYLTGYTSSTIGNSFIVFAPLEWGAAANAYSATLRSTGGGGTVGPGGGGSTGTLVCNIDSPTNETIRVGKGSALVFSKIVHASGAGGTPPYLTYLWEEKTAGSGDGIKIGSKDSPSTNFTKTLAINTSAYGIFKCTVTDNVGGIAVSIDVTVLLENDSSN